MSCFDLLDICLLNVVAAKSLDTKQVRIVVAGTSVQV